MFDMSLPATTGEIYANAGMYWIISVFVFMILDHYAKKKLGGARMLGYKILRVPRFFTMVAVSAITIGVLLGTRMGLITFSYTSLTFLGLPYFIVWIFFMVNVMRRIRAETKNRPGL